MPEKLWFNSWQGQQIYLISKTYRLTIEAFPASYSTDIGGRALSSGYSGQGVKIPLTST
jgi:hypothetical protein